MHKTRQETGLRSWRHGHFAEYAGALYLMLKGYRIFGLNRRTPFGEIDILAAKGKSLIAVEVKLRNDALLAAGAIHPAQQRRLLNALQFLAATAPHAHLRGDALLFVRGKTLPCHVKNAFFGN